MFDKISQLIIKLLLLITDYTRSIILLTFLARPNRFVRPPKPRHIAHTILDFPVPINNNNNNKQQQQYNK